MMLVLAVMPPVFLLLLGSYFFMSALEKTQPYLPAPLQDDLRARFALDSFIWAAPKDVRRIYRRSCVLSLAGFAWIGIALAAIGKPVLAALALFAVLFASVNFFKARHTG